MSEKKEYVLGFMFDAALRSVALIRKNKPDWQKGKLNGIGGKVENESKYLAMAREFKEECGHETNPPEWGYFLRMEGEDFEVHCFARRGDLGRCKTTESEPVEIYEVADTQRTASQMIENLPWIINLAVDYLHDLRPGFVIARYGNIPITGEV